MADNWQQIKEIVDAALRLGPEERGDYLEDACDGNDSVRHEVESLLSSFEKADGFMEEPAIAIGAEAETVELFPMPVGKMIGHYEIVRKLGEGGMGSIYLAKDGKLDRQVAIKILNRRYERNEDNVLRFIREAKAASALNHPNILTIHEIDEFEGSQYIVSEFVDGSTLRDVMRREDLDLNKIVDIVKQIAGALAAAHKARIIHRDIKPENVIVREDGYVKVLDFGLAKLLPSGSSAFGLDGSIGRRNETGKGVILGTVSYMSPEQASGRKVDERTDIFSLGVVLYEMIAGRTPFTGETMAETFANLINKDPEPLAHLAAGVPDEMERIVSKMLRKDPELRYQTMGDVIADLKNISISLGDAAPIVRTFDGNEQKTSSLPRTTGNRANTTAETSGVHVSWYKRAPVIAAVALLLLGAIGPGFYWRQSTTSPADIRSLAVLPLENLSGDPNQEYFADGMTEAIIGNLSQIGSLKVISRTSVMKYKRSGKSIPEIAHELGVEGIVEGSVQRSGDRIRINAQLIHAATDSPIWSRSFERQMSDILKLQSEIAQALAGEISVQVTPAEQQRLGKSKSLDPAATEAFLLGRHYFVKWTRESERQAVEQFQKAVSTEPEYADAWAGLADAWTVRAMVGDIEVREAEKPSREATLKALEIDPGNSAANTSMCFIKNNFDFDWIGGEDYCKRGIQLDPNNAKAHFAYAYLLARIERWDEMAEQMEHAMRLDPAEPWWPAVYGAFLMQAHRFEDSERQLFRSLQVDPKWTMANYESSLLYVELGRFDEAIKEAEICCSKNGLHMAYIYARTGDRRKALELLDQTSGKDFLQQGSARALVYAALNDFDKAFKILNEDLDRGNGFMTGYGSFTGLDKLRSDPRWNDILRRINRLS